MTNYIKGDKIRMNDRIFNTYCSMNIPLGSHREKISNLWQIRDLLWRRQHDY